jgi:hypothetical protein
MSKEPLYPRLLQLRHIHPSGWQRLVFWEGSIVVALLLWGADVASGWITVVLPLAVALVVKATDLLAALLEPAPVEAQASSSRIAVALNGGRPLEETVPSVNLGERLSSWEVHQAPISHVAPVSPEQQPQPQPRGEGGSSVPSLTDLPAADLAALPAAVRADLAAVTEMGLTFARTLLERQGGFLPFAALVTADGKREAASVELPDDDPDPADVLDELHRTLRARRDELRAAAVLADAQPAPEDGPLAAEDVVLVELGHADGPSLLVVAPYAIDADAVSFGPISSLASGSGVWADEEPAAQPAR